MNIKGLFAAFALLIAVAQALPSGEDAIVESQATDRLVFAHFMIGITSNRRTSADYDDDMKRAKALGIDAFALNIGVDPYTDQQLNLAYESAAKNDVKVFISFDFNWYNIGQGDEVGRKVANYASRPAQLFVDGKVFVSSFAGDGLNIAAMRNAAGRPVFWAPNYHPSYGTDMSGVDGLLNWMAWDNDGNNKAPSASKTVTVQEGDREYLKALGNKAYIAPASPWFYTHFGPEVPYSKNWVFPSDLLWYERWGELLKMGPRFIEIVTWNDYGEAHYIGPLNSPHTDDGASKWINDMPHGGWLDMSKPYIAAYKAGDTSVDKYITKDELIYWYRPSPRNVNCDATDTCMAPANNASGNYFYGRPNGWETMEDAVFVVALLTAPATLEVRSGSNTKFFEAPAGASAHKVPMGVGEQSYLVYRDGKTIMAGTSLKDIIDSCVCGLYNFNPYVGTLPEQPLDTLLADGLMAFSQGLRVSTCRAVPTPGSPRPPPIGKPPGGPTGTPTTTTTSKTTSKTTSTSSTKPTDTTTTTTIITTTTTTKPTATNPGPGPGQVCVRGTGPGNYIGLCDFCCKYGYCPSGPCTCSEYGAPVPTPPTTGWRGVPLPGLGDSYLGLCSFACDHGYCPGTACVRA